MKVVIKGIKEDNLEELVFRLSGLGIDPSPIYKSAIEGKTQATINCPTEKLQELKSLLGKDYQIIPLEEDNPKDHPGVYIALLSLFLDNLLVFYLLKFSIWSADFNQFLNRLFISTTAITWTKNVLSLLFLGFYYYAFLFVKGAPPIASLLGLRYTKDKPWVFLSYTLPLPSIYLISIGSGLFKLLGLGLLSFSVGIALYSRDNVKFS